MFCIPTQITIFKYSIFEGLKKQVLGTLKLRELAVLVEDWSSVLCTHTHQVAPGDHTLFWHPGPHGHLYKHAHTNTQTHIHLK